MPTELRVGDPLLVRGEALPFSFWPLRREERRWGRHSMVFASNPWAIIQSAVVERCPPHQLEAAQSFVRQAAEYHAAAAGAGSIEAQPLLYYYGFLNLGKALAITRGRTGLVGRVEHGLRTDSGSTITNAQVTAYQTGQLRAGSPVVNAFDELMTVLTGDGLPAHREYTVFEVMAQILFGHRLWVEGSRRKERFIGIQRIELRHTKATSQVWMNIVVPERALVWRGRSKQSVLADGDLADDFDYVRGVVDPDSDIPLRVFQQSTPSAYGHRPSDDLMDLIERIRPRLWRAISTGHPFRRYYLYLSDAGEHRLPQLLSAYLLMFHLGSVTRYNPPLFREMLDGRYGAFLHEFLSSQPQQFVYEIACEFKQQEVSRAGGV